LSSDSTRSEVVARLSHKFIYIDAEAHHNGFYFLSKISHLRDSLVSSPGTSTQRIIFSLSSLLPHMPAPHRHLQRPRAPRTEPVQRLRVALDAAES
jgi:hypothetical protein